MQCLKQSFHELLDKAEEAKRPVVLGAWNSLVEFCPEKEGDRVKWIDGLAPTGGNDMRYVIEHTMKRYPYIEDLYIMCDGDVSPFAVPGKPAVDVYRNVSRPESTYDEARFKPYAGTDWTQFCTRFAKVHFHFIALGCDADAGSMRKMASIG